MSIWISLTERPPPDRQTSPKLLLRFRSKVTGDVDMGYYLGNGEVRILGYSTQRQLPLSLDEIDAWQAINPDQLRSIENAEENESGSLAQTATSERHADRGNAAPSSGRDSEPPPYRGAAAIGFEDLEDYAEWAGADQETPSGTDPGGEPGDLLAGEQ